MLALVAVSCRFHALGRASLWIDEFASLQSSNGIAIGEFSVDQGRLREPNALLTQLAGMRPAGEVLKSLATDNHPPLYFLALRAWRLAFGDAEAALRALSALFSLAALALWWRVVRRREGGMAALVAVALLAFSGAAIRAAQQVRGYSMATAAVALAVLAVAELEAGGSRRRWGAVLAFAAGAALLTHYYAAGALAGLGIYCLAAQRGALRRCSVLGLLAGVAVFLAAWGPTLLEQRRSVLGNNQWVMEGAEGHVERTAERLVRLPVAALVDPRATRPPSLLLGALAWLALAAAAVLKPGVRLGLAAFLGAAGLVTAVDLALHSAQLATPRYVLFGAAGVAAALASLGPGRLRLVPAAALAVLLLGLPDSYRSQGPPWRDFAHMVDGVVRPHEPVLVLQEPPLGEGLWAYQALRHYAWAPARSYVLLTRLPGPGLAATLRRRGTAWVLSGETGDFESPVPGMRVAERVAWSLETPTLFRLATTAAPAEAP